MTSTKDTTSLLQSYPVVIKGQLEWESLLWKENNWVAAIKKNKIKVRIGKKNPGHHHPQWERYTDVMEVSTKDFLNEETRDSLIPADSWAYFDYKYMATELEAAYLPSFSWDKFGYPGRAGSDSTLWVGTEGAHTPCHQDTYGENLVAQLVGTKTWTLFPPSQGQWLSPTRVPYEESSVYSSVNFVHLSRNSPAALSKLSMTTPYIVTLHPGDVLYVPRHWWHQVYSNQFSISVNTWLEHPEDNKDRLGEAIVRCQVANIVREVNTDIRDKILNPNEDDLADSNIEELTTLCSYVAANIKCDNRAVYKKPNFTGHILLVEPSTINIPERAEEHPQANQTYYKELVKLINAVTNDSVIKEAINSYLLET